MTSTQPPYNGNPFTPGRVVPSERFIGRTDLIREIVSRIETKGSLSLIGEARMGKSSLLQYLAVTLESELVMTDGSRFVPIHLDMERCHSPSDFYKKIGEKVLPHLPSNTFSQALLQRWEHTPNKWAEWKSQDFDALIQATTNSNIVPVLLIDEFKTAIENSKSFTPQFLNSLRSFYQNAHLVLLIATRQPLKEIPDLNLYFANGFLSYTLANFTPTESRLLLSQPHNRPFDTKAINKGLEVANHHPLRLQLVGNYLYKHHNEIMSNGILHPNTFNKISAAINPQFEEIEQYNQQKPAKRNEAWHFIDPITSIIDKIDLHLGRIQTIIFLVTILTVLVVTCLFIANLIEWEQLNQFFRTLDL